MLGLLRQAMTTTLSRRLRLPQHGAQPRGNHLQQAIAQALAQRGHRLARDRGITGHENRRRARPQAAALNC